MLMVTLRFALLYVISAKKVKNKVENVRYMLLIQKFVSVLFADITHSVGNSSKAP